MNPLSHALSRNENNFGLVRLLAAIAVVYGYSNLLQLPDGSTDWVRNALGFDGLGALGVYAFFLLSGMLVTASFDRQRSAPRFVALRIARIWPAVAGGSLVTVFVIGPLFTTLPLREYFASGVTWANLDNCKSGCATSPKRRAAIRSGPSRSFSSACCCTAGARKSSFMVSRRWVL
jgi:peptidoglycan/LPS O-acetylase OafA/YrhL